MFKLNRKEVQDWTVLSHGGTVDDDDDNDDDDAADVRDVRWCWRSASSSAKLWWCMIFMIVHIANPV